MLEAGVLQQVRLELRQVREIDAVPEPSGAQPTEQTLAFRDRDRAIARTIFAYFYSLRADGRYDARVMLDASEDARIRPRVDEDAARTKHSMRFS
jgi:hypothetical protein